MIDNKKKLVVDDINIKKTRISSDEPVIQISEVRLVEN